MKGFLLYDDGQETFCGPVSDVLQLGTVEHCMACSALREHLGLN